MADVRDLLSSTTPDVVDVPDVDLDAVARRGTRRRVGKRLGATVLALALLGGSLVVLTEMMRRPDLQIVEQPEAGQWESLPAAPLDARQDPFVEELDDGRVVVAGGLLPDTLEGGPGGGLSDGAVLDADHTSWRELPDAPFTGSLVEFTVRDSTLWAREVPMLNLGGDPATGDGVRLAMLDLDDQQWQWDQLPPAPVDPFGDPIVTIIEDAVVVFGATAQSAPGPSGPITSGAVWRNGSWTPFDDAPRSVSGGFLGFDSDHLAVVGGEVDGETVADTSILDLQTATWRTADPMPAGPRTHFASEASAIVVDGRMLVAGGIAARSGAPTTSAPTVDEELMAPPCTPDEPDCGVSSEDGQTFEMQPDEAASGGQAAGSVTVDPDVAPDTPAEGAAWLNLETGSWDQVELPMDHTVLPLALRPDGLTAPTTLKLVPNEPTDNRDTQWRVVTSGEFIQFQLPDLPFPATHIELDPDGTPVLALATRTNGMNEPDRTVAVPGAGGAFVEATLPEPLDGVTYLLIDDQLHAFGGVPYSAQRDETGRVTSQPDYHVDAPLIARVPQR